jgi:hypothetical protein
MLHKITSEFVVYAVDCCLVLFVVLLVVERFVFMFIIKSSVSSIGWSSNMTHKLLAVLLVLILYLL